MTTPAQPVEKLVYNTDELCAAIDVCSVTLWRLEKKGLIRCVPGLRHKRYSKTEVARYLAGATGAASR
jgi:hypothetical protein